MSRAENGMQRRAGVACADPIDLVVIFHPETDLGKTCAPEGG